MSRVVTRTGKDLLPDRQSDYLRYGPGDGLILIHIWRPLVLFRNFYAR